MKDTDDIRRQANIALFRHEIEVFLQGSLREEEWRHLIEEHYVDELLNGFLSSNEVADRVRHLRQVYGQRGANRVNASRISSEQESKEPSGYLKALSFMVAQEVARDKELQAFRAKILGGNLLSFEAVEEWIQGQAKADGPFTWWLTNIPVSRSYMIDVVMYEYIDRKMSKHEDGPLGVDIHITPVPDDFTFHFLTYNVPDFEYRKIIPTYVNGVLEVLRLLSKRLAEEYGWIDAEATNFVLTGHVPKIKAITHTLQSREVLALSRIVLTIDPALSPREVADHYRHLRQEIVGGRHRELGEKHLQLAVFAEKQSEDKTWIEKMREWNKTHPSEWKYEEVANFSHDCLQARRRLLRSE